MRVGLLSDTHGLLDPKLEELFAGCDLILHGGDVARHAVLEALGRLATVVAVRGNNDLGPFGESLPATAVVEVGALRAFLIHELGSPERPGPTAARARTPSASSRPRRRCSRSTSHPRPSTRRSRSTGTPPAAQCAATTASR